ncbi:class I SAM-dependent methyltransferase [Bradyrhizobium sp. HKCCYLS20291]|uniref:class I SAM-dependent methyltransferase n=1 Tax=Bradyrhizobium sp. HKCCYLS20291 TaxID=3420766 RepID=UPI003EBA98CB
MAELHPTLPRAEKLRFALKPDSGCCRLCGSGAQQRTVAPESHVGAGQVIRRCGVCAGVYLAPDFTDDSLDRFYRHHYRRLFPFEAMWGSERRFFAWRGDRVVAALRFARVQPHLARGAHLLEMGSGFGAFLGAAAGVDGIRLSATEPDITNRTRLIGGADVAFVPDIDAVAAGDLDVVVAFHVLEHLAEPGVALKQVLTALKPGGRAFFEVPDLMRGAISPSLFHPAHLSYFTVATLSALAGNAGFRIISAGPHPDGGVLADNIWIELQKPSAGETATAAPPATVQDIAAIDARLAAVDWQPTRRQQLQRAAKRLVLATAGPGPIGELQRYRQRRALRRVGWT